MRRLLLLVALVAAACGSPAPRENEGLPDGGASAPDAGSPAPEPIDDVVIPVYLAASDTPSADAATRAARFAEAVRGVSGWYGHVVNGDESKGFRVHSPYVVPSTATRATWDDWAHHGWTDASGARPHGDGCPMWWAAEEDRNARPEAWAAAGVPEPTEHRYFVVLTGGGDGGGCGAGNLSAVEDMLLSRIDGRCRGLRYDDEVRTCSDPEGLGETDPWCAEWPHAEKGYECTCMGALAHEIGHGLGLPHCKDRPACTGPQSIMDLWWEWGRNGDAVSLSDQDRADLATSPYLPH